MKTNFVTGCVATCSISAILFFLAENGPPIFSRIAGAIPAIIGAISLLIFRTRCWRQSTRTVLLSLAVAGLLVASGIGFSSLWRVAKYLVAQIQVSPSSTGPQVGLAGLNDAVNRAWAEGHWPILLWTAMAFLPLVAAGILSASTLKRWFAPTRKVDHGPWTAEWMSPIQIKQLATNETGIPLGRQNGRLLRYKADNARGFRGGHHFLFAGSRAGKGVSAVLPAIVDHDGPVVALDPKGELFAITRRWRSSLGRRVIVLNPLGVVELGKDGFNPLDYVRAPHRSRDAAVIAEGLVKPEPGAGAHFSTLGAQLIAAAIEVVTLIARPDERTLITVADMLLGGDIVPVLEEWRKEPETLGRVAVQAASAILGASDRERGAIMTTVSKALSWCASDEMRSFLSHSDWTFDDVLDDKADIFVVVPMDQVGALSIYMRLVVNLIMGAVTRQDGRRTLPKSLLLVLDEFVRLGRMEKLLDVATVAAGAGVEALFVTQDRGQVEGVYGREDASTLLASCSSVRVFGLGRTDTATADWIANTIGDQTVEVRGQELHGKRRVNGSEQRAKLLSTDQLLELPADQMVALFPGQRPALFNRIISHTDRDYREKLDPNPTIRAGDTAKRKAAK